MLPSTQHLMPTITTRAGAPIKVGARPQARKPASKPNKKQKRPQALRRTHGPVQGRKAASLRKPLGGPENPSNQTLDPLWEGWGATKPHKPPRFRHFLSALIILY